MMKNNKSKDCQEYLIKKKKNAKYSADGKAKAIELSLPLCQQGKWAVHKVVAVQYWLVFSVVESLSATGFCSDVLRFISSFDASVLLFWENVFFLILKQYILLLIIIICYFFTWEVFKVMSEKINFTACMIESLAFTFEIVISICHFSVCHSDLTGKTICLI